MAERIDSTCKWKEESFQVFNERKNAGKDDAAASTVQPVLVLLKYSVQR